MIELVSVTCSGSSAVGQRVVRQVKLTSSSRGALPLSADLLGPQHTFTVVNAVRPVAPQGRSTLLLDFTPQVSSATSTILDQSQQCCCLTKA